jgi:ATP-dependent protease ClpP protease subunit
MATQKEKTAIDDFLVYGIDTKNRIIHFGISPDNAEDDDFTSFNSKTVETVIRGMNRMIYDSPKAPISLYMNSGGGSTSDAFYLIDFILASSCQIKFYGGGWICSAASLLMAVCDERYLYPNTRVMLHEHSVGMQDKYTNNKIDMIESDILHDRMCKLYADNSIMDEKFYKQLLSSGRDAWMSAQDAVNLGLADDLVPAVKRGNLRKKRQEHLKQSPSEAKLKKTVEGLLRRTLKEHQHTEIIVKIPQKDESDPNITIGEPVSPD